MSNPVVRRSQPAASPACPAPTTRTSILWLLVPDLETLPRPDDLAWPVRTVRVAQSRGPDLIVGPEAHSSASNGRVVRTRMHCRWTKARSAASLPMTLWDTATCPVGEICHITLGAVSRPSAWVDGECWAVRPDYSPAAVKAFQAATGIPDPPRGPFDRGWQEFLDFHREAFRKISPPLPERSAPGASQLPGRQQLGVHDILSRRSRRSRSIPFLATTWATRPFPERVWRPGISPLPDSHGT
jgi:hypothetical protein